MELARDGDRTAFARIVAQHAAMAFRLAASIVGPTEADDVVQEAFVSAWVNLPQLRRSDRFEPWLRQIVVNGCRAQLRAVRRRPATPLRQVEQSPVVDDRDGITERVNLEQAFRRLDDDSKVILALHYVADLSLSQVADELGVPVGTVKSRLNKALRAMRDGMALR